MLARVFGDKGLAVDGMVLPVAATRDEVDRWHNEIEFEPQWRHWNNKPIQILR
jgi:hypothetical protein